MINQKQSGWIDGSILKTFGLRSPVYTSHRLTGGFQHEVWKVISDSSSIVLKRQKDEPNELGVELEKIAAKYGIATAAPVYTLDGEPCIERDGNYIRAYQFVPGKPLDREPVSEHVASALGKQLALLHTASLEEIGTPSAFQLELPKAEFGDEDDVSSVIQGAANEFINSFEPSSHILLIGHRDIGGKNTILAEESDEPYLIDFDEAGVTTIDGEIIDAAFNLAGVHSSAGVQQNIVRAFVDSYRSNSDQEVTFIRSSFHMLIGMSECWWLSECYRRTKRSAESSREQDEIVRLLQQIPRDVGSINEWLDWLK